MSNASTRTAVWVLAALSILVGLAMTANSFIRAGERREKLEEYAGYMEELDRLRERGARNESVVRMFEELPDAEPTPMAQLLAECFPGQPHKMMERSSPRVLEGWTAKRVEVSFADIELGRLGEFLVRAESGRPPWRLVTCAIRSTRQQGGYAQATLVFEAVARQ